jgi:predicted nucleic-acid-binding protein
MSKEVNTANSNISTNVDKKVNSYINLSEQSAEKTLDTLQNNMMKSFDEYVKIQPRFLQSVSDFQLEVIQSSKDAITKTIAHQKELIREYVNVSQSQPNETYQQLFNKTNENVDNFVKAITANNQFNFDAIDTTRENVKLYNKTLDAYTEYVTNAFNAWNAFIRSFYQSK